MSEFNSDALRGVAVMLEALQFTYQAGLVRDSIQRYGELQERLTITTAEHRAEMGRKNARITELEDGIATLRVRDKVRPHA